jgi:signal transduction histidine kinase
VFYEFFVHVKKVVGVFIANVFVSAINDVLQYLLQFFTNETKERIQLSLKKNYMLMKRIETDKEKLYAALTNLLKNAVKFTNLGTINLAVKKKETI